ncbi:MAG: DNA repair protein RadA [Alphaproteobacteria bacterium]
MARAKQQFVCQNCGAVTPRWQGRCGDCGGWNTLIEETVAPAKVAGATPTRGGRIMELVSLAGATDEMPRTLTGIAELDRVTGGGLVPAATLLVGGAPGIGKSTLLLQAAGALARTGQPVVYVSGEEAIAQIRLRAERLNLLDVPVQLAAETNAEDILTTLAAGPTPKLVIIDSIQTLWSGQIDSAPGTVTQVRAAAQTMIRYAKRTGATIVLVGHVTKDGQIAGPRVVEHMVDAVLYFEGEGDHRFRILRAVKNRFGPTDEIGVFEMTGAGLREVDNPSELFLGERGSATPGAAVFAGMEGSRPLLVEIQALVAPTTLGTARRAVVGWDSGRLAMILAVLESHCGVRLGDFDVYLNVAGGLRIVEPAADLAVAAALVSSRLGRPLPADAVYFGEISLSGSLRPVAQSAARLKEARKLGFDQSVTPVSKETGASQGQRTFARLPELVAAIGALPEG